MFACLPLGRLTLETPIVGMRGPSGSGEGTGDSSVKTTWQKSKAMAAKLLIPL